ncbi:Versiconal hemiacetal acetate reductase [Pseudocercospora fuligena]|uniref:Versiconal hemiacetal acetate reductase n=1 Tax=Pseudocercospora fuligena TaxID=685502 RepID=A0A8H6VQM9_9PEZI|nr:Versiconal hemiacetal acetate reductase [Pseudocercospora fuligena]
MGDIGVEKEEPRPISKAEVLSRLPPSPASRRVTSEQLLQQPVLVVLDDDPTGTQTCHDINVLTVWDEEILCDEFESGCAGFFILTNSRALPSIEARRLIKEICHSVKHAAAKAGKGFEIVLRGDSTLRGHFPDEPEAAEEALGEADVWILAPFFEQGGRLTIDDIHYVASHDGQLIPAAQTPFAEDATFGYTQSNLRQYVREKSKGAIGPERIHSVSLEDIRVGGADIVAEKLRSMQRRSVVIVNAVTTADVDVFVQGLLSASATGKKFLYRTGAAFVSSRLGIEPLSPLKPRDLKMDLSAAAPGGLIIAGSYVPKTTEQLQSLVEGRGAELVTIELDASKLLETEKVSELVLAAANEAGSHISNGQDVLLMTSRKLITGDDELSSLKIGSVVASALVSFLRYLIPRPRYIIAKGGITSSDAATKGLMFKRASIRGQAAAGVPLWQCYEPTSKFPDLPYVVFPGNVGESYTLRDLVASWGKGQEGISLQPMQHQRLGNSGLKVSRLILGCMTFGNPNWEGSPWILPEEQALPLLKKAYDVGINTFETANSYSNGESERIIGKALRTYDMPRSKVVIMTKLYYPVLEGSDRRPQPASNDGELVNQMGLSRKHIFEAVDGSLRRLGTSYIDVLQLHRLDKDTRPEEIMEALHDLVKMGKVHYIGASSMYCWQFARLQYTAKMHNWTTFTSMSGLYNLLYREEEREMIPFCEAEGVGLIPWSPVARGLLTRPWFEQTDRSKQDVKTAKWFQSNQNETIVGRVEKLAMLKDCSLSSIALAWLMHKNACPIVGLNSISRIEAVSEALGIHLTAADMQYLEEPYQPVAPQAM